MSQTSHWGLPGSCSLSLPILETTDYCHSSSCSSCGGSCLEGGLYASWTCLLPACLGCSCLVQAVPSVTLSILFPNSQWQQASLICVLCTSQVSL